MFHSEKAEDPIHVGYGNPTVAGVLTGFDASVPEKEYWEVFIRRHDNVAGDLSFSAFNRNK